MKEVGELRISDQFSFIRKTGSNGVGSDISKNETGMFEDNSFLGELFLDNQRNSIPIV